MVKATTLIDDVDGSADAKTRLFSIGGCEYEIDLSNDNYARLLKAIDPWRSRARVARRKRHNPTPVLTPEDRVKIREWADAKGRYLAPRGRFPSELVREYYSLMSPGTVDITMSEAEYQDLIST
jgi:hypothetical protein